MVLNETEVPDIFSFKRSLNQIAIPPNMTKIGDRCFTKCKSLKRISIPSSIIEIGNYAFKECAGLEKFSIPSSVISIGYNVFDSCNSLTQISIPLSLTKISNGAFINCKSLEQILIPPSITYIGSNAFKHCSSLKEIDIPPSVTYIGSDSFNSCSSLKTITLPPNLTCISSGVFYGCSSLEIVVIPNSVTQIESKAFLSCSSLKSIMIPNSVTEIESKAFLNCSSLKSVVISNSVTKIESETFRDCSSLENVVIPNSVTKIESRAFLNCSSLSNVSIPSSVTTMEDDAFEHCHPSNEYNPNMYIPFFIDGIFMMANDFAFITLILLFFEFIISVIWWYRLHPWFAHGYILGKIVYYALKCCWVSSIFAFAVSLIYIFYNNFLLKRWNTRRFFRRNKAYFIYHIKLVFFKIFCIFGFISMISIFVASVFALKRKKIDGKPVKCLKYIFDGNKGALNWVINQSTEIQNNYYKWYSKMLKKAFKKNGKASEYYCFQVGVPAIFFFALFVFFVLLYGGIFLFKKYLIETLW